jgi:hypothetical protein
MKRKKNDRWTNKGKGWKRDMKYRMEEIEGMIFYKRVSVQISTGIALVGI